MKTGGRVLEEMHSAVESRSRLVHCLSVKLSHRREAHLLMTYKRGSAVVLASWTAIQQIVLFRSNTFTYFKIVSSPVTTCDISLNCSHLEHMFRVYTMHSLQSHGSKPQTTSTYVSAIAYFFEKQTGNGNAAWIIPYSLPRRLRNICQEHTSCFPSNRGPFPPSPTGVEIIIGNFEVDSRAFAEFNALYINVRRSLMHGEKMIKVRWLGKPKNCLHR